MLGLVKKDLLLIKSNLKVVGIMLGIFFFMALQGSYDLSFLPAMICMMLFITTFSYDEYNKWDAYVIALPNGRKNVVKSKYIATLILIAISILITILLNIVIGYINNDIHYKEIFSVMSGCAFAIILMESIGYPIIFKFGTEKGRIGLFIVVFGITAIIGGLSKIINIDASVEFINFIEKYWFIMIPIVTIIMVYISYLISKKIYLKREF